MRRRRGKEGIDYDEWYKSVLCAPRRVGIHRDGSRCKWRKAGIALSLPVGGRRWPAVAAARRSVCGTVRTTHVTGVIRSDYDGRRRWLLHILYQWTDGHMRLCTAHLRRYKGNTAGEGGGNGATPAGCRRNGGSGPGAPPRQARARADRAAIRPGGGQGLGARR